MRVNLSENEYRALEIDSYSSISKFLDDRIDYYYRYVFKSKKPGTLTEFTKYGSLVDCLLFTPDEYKDRFCIPKANIPKPQMLEFIELVAKLRIEDDVTLLNDLINKAYALSNFGSAKLETVRTNFYKDEDYYYEILDHQDKIIISDKIYNKAQRCKTILETNRVTNKVINQKSTNNIEVIDQCMIVFDNPWGSGQLKCMIDKLIIDHDKKVVQIYDLKTSSNIDTFYDSYLKYKYYIQGAVYYAGVNSMVLNDPKLSNYIISPIQFIVCDSSNYRNPLIYTTNMSHLTESIIGFKDNNNNYYYGLEDAIKQIEYAKKNNDFTISMENDLKDGRITLPLGV